MQLRTNKKVFEGQQCADSCQNLEQPDDFLQWGRRKIFQHQVPLTQQVISNIFFTCNIFL